MTSLLKKKTNKPKAKKIHYDCILEHDPKFNEKLKNSKMALRKLAIITVICFLFMVAEVVGGYLSKSVAIMTDAAHMLSDCSGFIISIFSIIIG
jgi:zinc transporter 2